MVTINLLPWREYTRLYEEKRVRNFLMLTFVLCLLFSMLVHIWLNKKITFQQSKVMQWEEKLDKVIHTERLLQKTHPPKFQENALKNKAYDRRTMYQFFMELGKAYLNDVCFTEIHREKNRLIFSGNARSAIDLTQFFEHWQVTKLFSEIKIDELQYHPENQSMHFRFQAMEQT